MVQLVDAFLGDLRLLCRWFVIVLFVTVVVVIHPSMIPQGGIGAVMATPRDEARTTDEVSGLEVHSRDDPNPDSQSHDPVHGGAEGRPPPGAGHKLVALLPSILDPVGRETRHEEPRRSGDTRRGDYHECHRDTALDGDDSPLSVGHPEADIDECDRGKSEGIDGRRIEPPEPKR
jgi:hypothetical protein